MRNLLTWTVVAGWLVALLGDGRLVAANPPPSPAVTAAEETPSAGKPIDLLASTEGWEPWSARPVLMPKYAGSQHGGIADKPSLLLSGNSKPETVGCWKRLLPPVKQGRRYLVEAAYKADGVELPFRSIWGIIGAGDDSFTELMPQPKQDGDPAGWQRVSVEMTPDKDYADLDLRLYLAWSPNGRVTWSDARITDVTDRPVAHRTVRVAAISGRWTELSTSGEALARYLKRIDEVATKGYAGEDGRTEPVSTDKPRQAKPAGEPLDLIVLPEVINTDGVARPKDQWSETIPGPFADALAAKARQYNLYLAASLRERDGDIIYNTGVLFDRQGKLVGKYRKTHCTVGEAFFSGVTPGDDYPIFQTDFGPVGYMICFDNHYPEVARLLSLGGAKLIIFSNMSDGREGGDVWEACMRTRAVDNNVHIVAAVNYGRSLVVSPRGKVLSMTDKTKGAAAVAECDLNESVRNSTKRPIGDRYLHVRRFDTFDGLTRPSHDPAVAGSDRGAE